MTPAGRITEGSNKVLGDYPFYGAEVLSATAGKVVGVVDRLPDRAIDFELPPPLAGDAGGNHVVVAIGGGRYAFYAHLQPGSIRVKVGQRVRPGVVLGDQAKLASAPRGLKRAELPLNLQVVDFGP
ncbi:MAG: M23 family metallopeptidase [Solirubrobacterales bacterium]